MIRAYPDYYRIIFESISDGIVICGRDGTIMDVNEYIVKMYGMKRENLIGKKCKELLYHEKYNSLHLNRDQKLEEVFETKKTVFYEDTRDGMWLAHRLYPIFEDDTVIAAACISSDITAIKAAEESKRRNALLEKEAAMLLQESCNKNLLLNTLSHELRNPLSTMTAWLSLIKLSTFNLEKIYFDIIEKEIKQIKHLSDHIIDISRLESGMEFIRSFLPENTQQ